VYGYQPVVVTTCAPDQRLTNGLVFCQIDSWLTGRRLVSLPFSDHCEPIVNDSAELDKILLHAKKSVSRDRLKYAEIRPISVELNGCETFSRMATYRFHRLDLTPSAAELFRSFHKDCVQRKIRRAERENLRYEAGNSEELLQNFYRLLVMTRRRQFLPPQPLEWFRGLIAAFGKDIKIRLASKDGVAIAAILTLSHKTSVVYKYGCSDAALNKSGGNALLFWKTIQEAKSDGYREFDMGRSDNDNHGLIRFKEHWGAVGMSISYWCYPPRRPNPLPKWKSKIVEAVVSASPDLLLRTVGNVLYKHIG
jgi:hypothetical protein